MRNRLDAHRIFGAQLYEWQWLQTLNRTQSLLLRTKHTRPLAFRQNYLITEIPVSITQNVGPMLFQCWVSVVDDQPPLESTK